MLTLPPYDLKTPTHWEMVVTDIFPSTSVLAIWRPHHRCESIAVGQVLRIELPTSARVGWSHDGWRSIHDVCTVDQGCGSHVVELPTAILPEKTIIAFTMFWLIKQSWEGIDYQLEVRPAY